MTDSTRKGEIALVTGASRGIGAAVALRLAREGYDLWLNYLSGRDRAGEVAARARELGVEATPVPFDVADGDAVEAALDPLLKEATPSVLVNNAGLTRDTLFGLMSRDEWNRVLDVNLGGFFNVTRTVMPRMLRKRRGRIVNIASTSGQTGVAGQVNYSAAKAGLIGATRSLAAETAKRGVLVNAVAPGFVESDMTRDLDKERYLPMIPLGRFAACEEVAAAVAFLVSPRASYITGQVLAVNGGVWM